MVKAKSKSKNGSEKKKKEERVTFNIDKEKNFSEWFTEIIKTAELADIRYNVKGFLVFQPWSVMAMEKMYKHYEKVLQRKGHRPYWFPTVLSEKNFYLEKEHVKGFSPEVFWITEAGNTRLNEKLALRPTSETAFYQMFSLWIRSYKDLPFKTYQRANVFRYETKATRPFLRSREFHWIETHCAHATQQEAEKQVKEDMETSKELLRDIFCLPFIFFERPQWDKFAGAEKTFAADVLNPDGKLVQQPSTHLLGQNFSKPFNVKFKDKDGKEKYCFTTCYGPAISRIFASIVIVHGDNKGLKFPWNIAPVQVIIVPIGEDREVARKAEEIKREFETQEFEVEIDSSDKTPGEKFFFWEMKGVPLRIELGIKEIREKELTIYRRDIEKKEKVKEKDLLNYIIKTSESYDENLLKHADALFEGRIKDVKSREEIRAALESGEIARCGFCSINKEGEKCAEVVEKDLMAKVRGKKLEAEKPSGSSEKCAICGKKAQEVVYIAREY